MQPHCSLTLSMYYNEVSLVCHLFRETALTLEGSLTGIPVTSMREIRVLQQCRHPNIVHLQKVVTGSKPDR